MFMNVKAKTGEYIGHMLPNGVTEFLGIPYAGAPKRWKRAEEMEASNEVFKADKCGPACWQHIYDVEWEKTPPLSEDCLNLNMWIGDRKTESKPVMIWIHGGSFFTGSNRTDCFNGVYCGDQFVADNPDIIYININYRHNIFGLFDLSSIDTTGEYADSTNLAILDQIAAIKWVKENIQAFGGNPNDITIFGQSAGGASVASLCCIKEANQYFNKAIIQSAGLSDTTIRRKEEARDIGKQIIKLTGANNMDELLSTSAKDLVKYAELFFQEGGGDNTAPFAPTWGYDIFPENPLEALRNGVAKHLTIMTGTTSGEYASWVAGMSEAEIIDLIMAGAPTGVTQEMIDQFIINDSQRNKRDSLIDLHMDSVLRMAQLCVVEALTLGNTKVFNYYISCIPSGAKFKPQHCFELPYISGKPSNYIYLDPTSGEPCQGKNPVFKLQGELQGCWANFARHGDPNGNHINISWPNYTLEHHETLVVDYDLSIVEGVREKDRSLVMPIHCDLQ